MTRVLPPSKNKIPDSSISSGLINMDGQDIQDLRLMIRPLVDSSFRP